MKRSALVVYIAMIIVGIIGLFFYLNQSKAPVSPQTKQQTPQETIAVAVARRNLEANSVLQADDFQIKNVSVNVGSLDTQFNLSGHNPLHWALKSPVAADAYIPPSALVMPGSDDYLAMFLQPGNVLYTFTLEASDNYLLTNLKPGQGVDIFLSYSIKPGRDGVDEIVSPAHSIKDSRLKPLMTNKRVLAMRTAKTVAKNGVDAPEKGSQLITELTDNEVKILKGLEGKTRILLFPAAQENTGENKSANGVLSGREAAWPVSDQPIFNEPQSEPISEATKVNELRG